MRLDDDQLIVPGSEVAVQGGAEPVSGSEHIHRVFDLIAAATGMILFAPIFLVTAIAIKLDSDGPIFVREPKFGHGNQKIQLFNFRLVSTREDANAPTRRPTRIGQILSETGIDELPQLLNVLRGELSIIGPPPGRCPNPLLNKVKPGMVRWDQIFAARKQSRDEPSSLRRSGKYPTRASPQN
jgi:lipopolysaccharide/colanic/teichoic acid biosynthesis glycosyltransferase